MATYLVGDIQGCYNELKALLVKVDFNLDIDELYVAGDLVARGPNSLQTLRLIKSLGTSAKIVLGNHDLHFLAVQAGIKQPKKSDLLDELLNAPDVEELADWLANQPLIQKIPTSQPENSPNDDISNAAYMSHAGISPQWTLSEALTQANFVHERLISTNRKQWLTAMYGETPNNWLDATTEIDKFRFSINSLTRMRFCFHDGSLEFKHKDSPERTNNDRLVPWYNLSPTLSTTSWVFGHWASLMGQCTIDNLYPLDTGCVWGHQLTMLRWHDKKYFLQQAL